jgi:hypothetical protein
MCRCTERDCTGANARDVCPVLRNDDDHREFCEVEESDALICVASTTSGSIIKNEKYKSCVYLY